MKEIFLTLVVTTLLQVGKGQKSNFEYGFQCGLNISSAYGNGVIKDYASSLAGLHIGGFVKINETENWGIKFLICYDKTGWEYKSLQIENAQATGLVNADVLFKMSYLNLPVLAVYSFGKSVQINIDGGPFIGFLLNNKIITKLKEPIPPNQQATTQSSSGNRKKTNIGLSLGSSIQVPIASKLNLDFNLRNNLGLSNIYKSGSPNSTRINTNTFSVSAGLCFAM